MTRHNQALATALASALALAALALPTTAHADRLLLTLGGAEQAVFDESFTYLSDDRFISDSHLGAQFSVIDGLRVGLEWDWVQELHEPIAEASTDLDLDTFLLTTRLEYPALSFLTPYLLAGGGVTVADLKLDLPGGLDTEQTSALFTGMLLGGLDIHIPTSVIRRWFDIARGSFAEDFTVGLYLEAGYRLSSSADFNDLKRPEPDSPPDEDEPTPIDAATNNLGTVDLSGAVLRSGLLIRF